MYYTTGACATDNEAVDAVIGAQTVAVAVFQDTLPDLYSVSGSILSSERVCMVMSMILAKAFRRRDQSTLL